MPRIASTTAQSDPLEDTPWTIVEVEPGVCAVATWHNFVITIWVAAGTQAAVARVARVTAMTCEQHPEKVSHVHLLKNGIGLPSSDARSGLVQIMKDHGGRIGVCAVMVGGSGFWASAMRSTITAMRMLAPREFELRLHGTLDEIMAWVPDAHRQCTGVDIPASALERVLKSAENLLTGTLEGVRASG
jgi:hypothetical protein